MNAIHHRITTTLLLVLAFAAAPSLLWAQDHGHAAEATGEGVLQQAEESVEALHDPYTDEHAAHADDAHHGEERALVPELGNPALWWEMLWTVVVFLIFFAVLSLVVWPKILGALQAREEKQRGDLAAAEKANADAAATLAQYKQQLADARKEAQRLIEQSRADAQKIGAELKEQAQAEIGQMRSRAQSEITAAKEQAIAELTEQAATLSTQVAARILRREIRPEDQRRLIDDSLTELAGNGRA